jgi:deoxyribonuclease-4
MARTLAQEQSATVRTRPKRTTARRIGIHTSIAGGVENAALRAHRLGCNTFQIFSSSPRQWRPYALTGAQCEAMRQARLQHDLRPLVIHTNYLINLAGSNAAFRSQSVTAFRGELERAVALGAEYLVVHPGSYRGETHAAGLQRVVEAVERAADDLDLPGRLTILIENTAGAQFSLGGRLEHLAELLQQLRGRVPAAACIDTCHLHVSGYDLVTPEGAELTLSYLDSTVGLKNTPVWHCNDAKAAQGSHLDRHQHIGRGSLGLEPFRRLLNDPRLRSAAFIAETPIDEPGDDQRNVDTMKSLVTSSRMGLRRGGRSSLGPP